MENPSVLHIQLEEMKMLVSRGFDDQSIQQELIKRGLDEALIAQLMSHSSRIRGAVRTRKGSLLVLVGVIILGIGFLSCVAIHFMGGEISLPLYGVTIIGLILVFMGLIKIFN